MKISVMAVGETDKSELTTLINDYSKRISRYLPITFDAIPLRKIRSSSPHEQLKAEGRLLLDRISDTEEVILLDSTGKGYTSEAFSDWIQERMNRSTRHLVFMIGGAYGFSEEVIARANGKISLSSMTFTHQMVRIILLEQIYRAFTILNNEPYHHG
ncbi:MAG: 23S rRNA (pseudouridine(1915)-N(3))-methyltransferase RlmH [Flavobacteriales bacterium]|nr:23S rRNA (pseudouridine(1915)-N(3))-methyltransferase RlmH [Flavobacteriales bacterium]